MGRWPPARSVLGAESTPLSLAIIHQRSQYALDIKGSSRCGAASAASSVCFFGSGLRGPGTGPLGNISSSHRVEGGPRARNRGRTHPLSGIRAR